MNSHTPRYCDTYDCPLGELLLVMDDSGLMHLDLPHEKHPIRRDTDWQQDRPRFAEVRRQLDEYFAGQRHQFALPLSPHGTAFQMDVWTALRDIPYGQTTSYGELARQIKRPRAVRAVGAANGANPLAIIVPCHRVIGSNGSLTGYGGGLPAKKWLLAHEQRHAPREPLVLV